MYLSINQTAGGNSYDILFYFPAELYFPVMGSHLNRLIEKRVECNEYVFYVLGVVLIKMIKGRYVFLRQKNTYINIW